MNGKHEQKRNYLAGKMLDGARALDDFFEALVTRRDANPEELHHTLADQYDLTPNQRAFFGKVATRTSKAQGIVRYLENRFGVNDYGEFVDASGLYSLVHKKKRPLKNIGAKTYNIGIGFVRDRWPHGDAAGLFINSGDGRIFSDSLKRVLRRLENDRYPVCKNLTFEIQDLNHIKKRVPKKGRAKDAEGKLLSFLFSPEVIASIEQGSTANHELRHMIDAILMPSVWKYAFGEYTATLYEEGRRIGKEPSRQDWRMFPYGHSDPFMGLSSDFERLSSYTKELIEIYASNLKRFPVGYSDNEKLIDLKTAYLKRLETEYPRLVSLTKRIPKEEYAAFSYLVSTTPHYPVGKVSHRLGLALEAYARESNPPADAHIGTD